MRIIVFTLQFSCHTFRSMKNGRPIVVQRRCAGRLMPQFIPRNPFLGADRAAINATRFPQSSFTQVRLRCELALLGFYTSNGFGCWIARTMRFGHRSPQCCRNNLSRRATCLSRFDLSHGPNAHNWPLFVTIIMVGAATQLMPSPSVDIPLDTCSIWDKGFWREISPYDKPYASLLSVCV